MVLAHKAANYTIGDSSDNMVEIPEAVCSICGGTLDPLLGKVMQGTTIDWTVWVEGNYEHRDQPSTPHAPRVKESA